MALSIRIKDNLNPLPVKTYRWLNVNHIEVNELIDKEIKPYNKKFVDEINNENILIGRINNVVSINEYMNKFGDEKNEYGVSDKMVQMAEDYNNT